jgi:hypothetical protein
MTARLLLKAVHSGRVSMSDRIVQTLRSAQEEPSKIDLNPGESLTIRDALIALMVKSANDISVAVAEKLSGSVEAFVAEMNVEAVKLGMTNTIYASPNGLPPPKKNEGKKRVNTRGFDISTPYDLAKLAIATIKEYPEILKFSSMVYATVPGKGGKSLSLRNHNNLLWKKGFVNRDVDGLKTGYIKAGKNHFIAPQDINNYRKNEVTILCTGSQGEPMAALSRVANGSHKYIKLIPGDTVIFSSSPIPGNAEGVNKTINALFKCGANVIVNSPINGTHTSGHANQGELRLLHSLTRPQYFMPIHGEYRMLKTHAKIASEIGCPIENTFVMANGDVLKINRHGASVEGKVKSGEVYIEGTRIGDFSSDIIRERKLLSNEGLFTIIFTIDMKNKTIPVEPQVVSRGFIYMKDSGDLTKQLTNAAKTFLANELKQTKLINLYQLQKSVTEYMTKIIVEETDRKPMVIPVFMQLNE